MIDRTEFPEASPAASRRVFHSKVDTIRPTYGFEDVSLAPGTDTVEPADVDLDPDVLRHRARDPDPGLGDGRGRRRRGWPASSPASAGSRSSISKASRPATTTRTTILERIATAADDEVQDILAEVYQQPIREDLIADRLEAIHAAGSKAAVAATPGAARRFGPFCAEHGADLFLVQSQVSSARHLATDYDPLSLAEFTRYMPIPVAVGNTTNAEAAFALMEQGAAAVFVGVGPGRGLHDPRGPRHRRPAGHGHQRRGRRPRRVPRRTPAATSRSSPTAGCAAVASWPRPSPPAPTS